MLLLPAVLSKSKGVGERLLEALIDEPCFELPMIDASYVRAPAHDTSAVGGSKTVGRKKGDKHNL